MASTATRGSFKFGRLSEEQWHELMRSLIEDVDTARDENRESSLVRPMADSVGEGEQGSAER